MTKIVTPTAASSLEPTSSYVPPFSSSPHVSRPNQPPVTVLPRISEPVTMTTHSPLEIVTLPPTVSARTVSSSTDTASPLSSGSSTSTATDITTITAPSSLIHTSTHCSSHSSAIVPSVASSRRQISTTTPVPRPLRKRKPPSTTSQHSAQPSVKRRPPLHPPGHRPWSLRSGRTSPTPASTRLPKTCRHSVPAAAATLDQPSLPSSLSTSLSVPGTSAATVRPSTPVTSRTAQPRRRLFPKVPAVSSGFYTLPPGLPLSIMSGTSSEPEEPSSTWPKRGWTRTKGKKLHQVQENR